MKELASLRRSATPPETDHPHARFGNAKSADSVEDNVECSVFGPPAAPPGGTVLIQVFLHLANQAEHASFLAGAMDASAKLKGTRSLDLAIKRGARVEIALSADGLVVDEPVQSVVWRGEPAFCQFLATIPAGTSGQSFFPVVRVSVDGKLVGPIKFRLSSDATASRPVSEPLGDHAGPYKYAFVSYATKDRKEVLKRVQMLEVLKTKFFQDILSIEPGDRWKKKLYENIDRCDLFLLFWSQAAKDSCSGSSRKPNTRSRISRKIRIASPTWCRSSWSRTCRRRQACPRSNSTIGSDILFRSCLSASNGGARGALLN